MPCNSSDGMSYGPSYSDLREVEGKLRMVEAVLCGILRSLSPSPEHARAVFNLVDWKEAGVTPDQAYKWWMDHVAKDNARRSSEVK